MYSIGSNSCYEAVQISQELQEKSRRMPSESQESLHSYITSITAHCREVNRRNVVESLDSLRHCIHKNPNSHSNCTHVFMSFAKAFNSDIDTSSTNNV